MDTLTHTVLGACVGDALAGKRIGKKAMLWGAIANNLPDIDVVTSLWMSQADGLLAHRGFTHSFLFAVVITPILSLFLNKRYRADSMRHLDWILLIGSGLIIHLLIDATTVYGTAWFEPFSHQRIAFNLLFVADLLYTLPFFIGAIVLLRLDKHHPRRRFWHRLVIGVNLLYLVFAIRNKIVIDERARQSLGAERIAYVEYMTTPTPLNNLLWYVVAATSDGYHIGYTSVLDTFQLTDWRFVPRNDSMLGSYKGDHEVNQLIRFSDGYYAVRKDSAGLELDDLRFGQVGGWYKPDAPFIFRYSLGKEADNDLVIQRGRMEAFTWEALVAMYNRICSSN